MLLMQTFTESLFATGVLFVLVTFWLITRGLTVWILGRIIMAIESGASNITRAIESNAREVFKVKGAIDAVADALTQSTEPPVSQLPVPRFRVFDPDTLITFEGENLMANIKSTGRRLLRVVIKNKFQGPGSIEEGSDKWTALTDTNAFFLDPVPPTQSHIREAWLRGNPQVAGTDQDIGLVRFECDGDRGEGVKPIVAEMAVDVTPADGEVAEILAGPEEEQDVPGSEGGGTNTGGGEPTTGSGEPTGGEGNAENTGGGQG